MPATETEIKTSMAMPRRRRSVVCALAVLSTAATTWCGPAIETGTKRWWPAAVRTRLKSVSAAAEPGWPDEAPKGGGRYEDEDGMWRAGSSAWE